MRDDIIEADDLVRCDQVLARTEETRQHGKVRPASGRSCEDTVADHLATGRGDRDTPDQFEDGAEVGAASRVVICNDGVLGPVVEAREKTGKPSGVIRRGCLADAGGAVMTTAACALPERRIPPETVLNGIIGTSIMLAGPRRP